jgi:hypothetical protein
MLRLSARELEILRYIRRARHKTTVEEIARGLKMPPQEVEQFVSGMVHHKLINVVSGAFPAEDSYYTNPEKREEIYELLG